jgi:NAD(P)-dependent dehydrogenase (short-subunit alcohol dehydrogenase family)
MARVFITGSADGLGRAAAQTLREHGHEVVVHVRNEERLAAVRDWRTRAPQPWSATCPTSKRHAVSQTR